MAMINATAPYTAFEAYFYDKLIAPSVIGFVDQAASLVFPHIPDKARVLDVGCGGGHLIRELARRRPDLKLAGLDLSREQIDRARKRCQSLSQTEFHQGSALDLPFEDSSFDAVISVASIKHWPNQRKGLEECIRVLRPGGYVMVLEADRGCSLEDTRAFVRGWKILPVFRSVGLAFFRTWVAGQSPDLDDARALLEPLPLEKPEVKRIPSTPGLIMLGAKPEAEG